MSVHRASQLPSAADLGAPLAKNRPTVVIVGAGFAGLTAARKLKRAPVRTVLVDRNNYHLFTPLLYEVASSLLDPSQIAQPVRAIIRSIPNAEFRLAQVESVDPAEKQILTNRGPIRYDYLVLAAGSVGNYFGNQALEERSCGLKDLDQALALRNRILRQFERARWTTDPEQRKPMLTFAVIGAGPTGIEYAGGLHELIHLVLNKDFPELDMNEVDIVLIEGSPRVLGAFHPRLQASARRRLAKMGVRLMLEAQVQTIDGELIHLGDGRTVRAGTVVWTAGVQANPLGATLGAELGRGGTVRVRPTLQIAGRREVFAIGDIAAVADGDRQLPQLAPVAMQEAEHAAHNIVALVKGKQPKPFHYRDKGIMATIGRNAGVVEAGPLRLSGFLGWIAWLFLHLILIVSLRNRLVVLINWTWDYLLYDRPVRIILESSHYPGDGEAAPGNTQPNPPVRKGR